MKVIVFSAAFFSVLSILSAQDHSEFIEGPFASPQEVTETCLTCHEEAGDEVMSTRHWQWQGEEFELKDGRKIALGKRNLINNFCIAVTSNWPRCTSCHIGYGWKDMTFDFTDPLNIDCLVCHEQTGTYKKSPAGAGYPEENVDLLKVAQSVALPKRANCGTCHFDGGGGTGVKHGDMDDSLYEPSAELDVHMGGNDFQCTECHLTEAHKISGAGHGSMAEGVNHISCMDCHDEETHSKSILNQHIKTVACETCHIPEFAKAEPTKIWWDWSAAGYDEEKDKDEFGKDIYDKKKGEFVWAKNVRPKYLWYDGSADYYIPGDKIKPGEIVELNKLNGNIIDPASKITPFKVMRGKQPFDPVNNDLIIPKLYGDGGYWKTFDWNLAAENGMKAAGLDYSGKYDFIETKMYWPINHMVVPKEVALKCTNCHGKNGDKYLDWKRLGFRDDPIKKGRRSEGNIAK